MFSSLRQGSPLYILDKSNLTLKVGSVISVPQQTSYQFMPNLMVPFNATVKFEDGSQNEFQQLQPNSSVALYGNVVVAETKEQMMQEVDQMVRNSKSVLDSMEYHKKVLVACDDMMKVLSPAFAKEKDTEHRLDTLEQGLGDIKRMLQSMSGNSSSGKYNNQKQN